MASAFYTPEEIEFDDIQEKLNCLCHTCSESQRFAEETTSISECGRMGFSGEFSESLSRNIDIHALTM